MARFKLEMDTWPIARLEARIANLLKAKGEKLCEPIDFNPWVPKSDRKRRVTQTINATQMGEMILGPMPKMDGAKK
ncbi:MAG: hypothetical protein ACIAQF_09210 [Phycisphaerales bacterium JB065]